MRELTFFVALLALAYVLLLTPFGHSLAPPEGDLPDCEEQGFAYQLWTDEQGWNHWKCVPKK